MITRFLSDHNCFTMASTWFSEVTSAGSRSLGILMEYLGTNLLALFLTGNNALRNEIRKFLGDTPCSPPTDGPILGGTLSLVELAMGNGLILPKRLAMRIAATGGKLKVLKLLRANGCPWDEHTCSNAAKGGHLEVLKWARANGCPWDKYTCSFAAIGGYLEVLKWLRANKCPWNKYTCVCAAIGGHLEVLKWLRVNECPWDDELVFYYATLGVHLEILEWLPPRAWANGCTV